jgi:hypothetical protein
MMVVRPIPEKGRSADIGGQAALKRTLDRARWILDFEFLRGAYPRIGCEPQCTAFDDNGPDYLSPASCPTDTALAFDIPASTMIGGLPTPGAMTQ